LRIATNNYLPTKIAREQIELARMKVLEAERNFYPSVTGEYKTADGKTITDPYESVSYGIQAEQLVVGLNQVRDNVRREEFGIYMARKNYDKVLQDLRYEISKAYYELVSQNLLLKHWQDTLVNLKPSIELVQKLYEEGLAIAADFENAQSQYKLISYQAVSVESAVYLAKLSLLHAMNLDTSKIDHLEVPLDFGFEAQDLGLEISECINLGLRHRPEIELWRMTCKSAKINEVINRREGLPKFSLSTSYGRSGEAYANQKLDTVDEWSLMGRLTWLWGPSSMEISQTKDKVLSKRITDTTLKTGSTTSDFKVAFFDKLNYYTAIKEANVTYHQSLHELNESKKRVIYEVKEAYLAYNRAISGIKSSFARLAFRENELKIIKARIEAGEGSPAEIVDAKVNLANEKAAYLRSLGEYYLAIASLDRATSYQLHNKT
jgi:outer membrane protein TolC